MHFTTLIFFILGISLTNSAIPPPTPPANETRVTVPADFFPDVVTKDNNTATNSSLIIRNKKGIDCCGEALQGWHGADIGHTKDNIGYLQTKGACWVGGGTCVRIACLWRSSIWLCNLNADTIAPACPYLASYADDIMATCSARGFYAGCGRQWDTDGYNVLIAEGDC